MPQTNSSRNRSFSDAYWKKRYQQAGVVPKAGGGVTVTKPTQRLGYEAPQDKQSWIQQNYIPITNLIQKGDTRVVSSQVLDIARSGFNSGYINQKQYDYIADNVERFRKALTTPVTSGGEQIPFTTLGQTGARGNFGEVQRSLKHSDLIRYNPDGSWEYDPRDANAAIRANVGRTQGLIKDANTNIFPDVGATAAGLLATVPLRVAKSFGYQPTFDENTFTGRVGRAAEGIEAGLSSFVPTVMSGISNRTRYAMSRAYGRTPEEAEQDAANLMTETPWYQVANAELAPAQTSPNFQLGSVLGMEAAAAVPSLYTSLGLLNAASSLGARVLSPFGSQASSIGRYAGIGAAVAAPPTITAFRDQLTGGQPGVREDIVSGVESFMDPVRTAQQRGTTESQMLGQQEFDPKGVYNTAAQRLGLFTMASGGAREMWRDVKNEAARGMFAFRGRLKETGNPFVAAKTGLAASVETEIGKAAAADLGFALTQPLGDIGRLVYSQTRFDKSKPVDVPKAEDLVIDTLLGLSASRPGKGAQWIFRGNPLERLEPKTMAIAAAVDTVNKQSPEINLLRQRIAELRGPDFKPNEADLRRVASELARTNSANLESLSRMDEIPEGIAIHRTPEEHIRAYVEDPDSISVDVRSRYDNLIESMRGAKDKIDIEDGNPLNNLDILDNYRTDLATRRRRINELTKALLPEYEAMFKSMKSNKPVERTPAKYYGLKRGDGTMLVFTSDFESARIVPEHDSPDIQMLGPNYYGESSSRELTAERTAFHRSVVALRETPITLDGVEGVPIAFTGNSIYLKDSLGNVRAYTADKLLDAQRKAKSEGKNELVQQIQDVIDVVNESNKLYREGKISTFQSDGRVSVLTRDRAVRDSRFQVPLIDSPDDSRGRLIDRQNGYGIVQSDTGMYYIVPEIDLRGSDGEIYPVENELDDIHITDLDTENNRITVFLPNVDTGESFPLTLQLTPDQVQAFKNDGVPPDAYEFFREAMDMAEPFKRQVGDIVTIESKYLDGTTASRRYVIVQANADHGVGLPIDNLTGTEPSMVIFDHSGLKVERTNTEFLLREMQNAQRISGYDPTSDRPTDDPLGNIFKYAFWLSNRNTDTTVPVKLVPAIVNATAEELPSILHGHILSSLDDTGLLQNVVGSMREWLAKNPDSAGDFEFIVNQALATELSKGSADVSALALGHLTNIARNADLNDLVDLLIGRFDDEKEVSGETFFSSSPRRIGRSQGQFQIMLSAVNMINSFIRRKGRITDERLTKIITNFLGTNPSFEGNLENAITTIKRLAQLSSSINHLAYGVISEKGAIWMMEKLSALPHEVQVLSALLPFDGVRDIYQDDFGNWFASKEKYDAAVQRARELYADAASRGESGIDDLRSAMYDARLGFFFEIAAAGLEVTTRRPMVNVTDPRAVDVIRANAERASNAVNEMIKRVATAKLAVLSKRLQDNASADTPSVPVRLDELATASLLAAPDGVLHPEQIIDQNATEAAETSLVTMQSVIDNVRQQMDNIDAASVLPGVAVYTPDEATTVGTTALATAAKAHEGKLVLDASKQAFDALPPQVRDIVSSLASPLLWFSDVVRAIDRTGDDNLREALVFALMNAQGTEGASSLSIRLNTLFRTEEAFNRFNDFASVVYDKVNNTDTGRKTAVRGAMDQLLKLVDSMVGEEGTSLVDDAVAYYQGQNLNPILLKTFIELASKELIQSLISNATRVSPEAASDVLGSINTYVENNRERIRRAGAFVGDSAAKAEALRLIESGSTDGLRYLGFSFNGQRRTLIQDAVQSLVNNMSTRKYEGSAMAQAQALLNDARELARTVADFVLGDEGLAVGQDPASAYTPAVEVQSSSFIDALRGGMTFARTSTGPDTAPLLMAGNRAGLEKIILATLLDAANKAELNYESVDKALMEAVVGPEIAKKYFERLKQEDFVKRKIIFSREPVMRAAIIPGVDGRYTLPTGMARKELIEGQAMFNSYVTKMLNLLKPRDAQRFKDALAEYVNKKRAESGDQVFVFAMADLLAIAEGFNETRGVLFRASADASELSFGVTNKDAHNAAYKIKSRLASIVTDVERGVIPNRYDLADQFDNLGDATSFIDKFEAIDIYEPLPDDMVTMNDAEALGTLYSQMSRDNAYTDDQKKKFDTLAKSYRRVARSKDDSPAKVINRYSDARVVSANLAKVYDTYAARMATQKVSNDMKFNYDLDDYKALTALLGVNAEVQSKVMAATSVNEIFTEAVLDKDQQRQLVALRAAQLKQDFYNQHHKLFFAHEAMMNEMGYQRVADSARDVDGFITRTKIANATSSILFMAASKNFGKSALTVAHEISHHLFFSLPDAQQVRWLKAVIPPLNRDKSEKVVPEEELVHGYLNKQVDLLNGYSTLQDVNLFRRQTVEQFAGSKYTPEQIHNAKMILGELSATSLMNFILNSGVVHMPNDRVSIAEDLTSSLLNLQKVLAPIAKTLSSEFGPWAMVGDKPTNVFYYSPSSVVYESPKKTGVNRVFYPLKHGTYVQFINNIGKKFSSATRVVDIHDVIMANKEFIDGRSDKRQRLVDALSNVITDRDAVNEIVDKLIALKTENPRAEYGKHYRISLSGDKAFQKQADGTTEEQGYPVVGRVVGMAHERVTARFDRVRPFKLNGREWFISSKNKNDNSQWYGLNAYEKANGPTKLLQSGMRGDYGYVVESTAQIRLHTLFEGKDIDLGDNKMSRVDVPVRFIVGHDYIDTSQNFHLVGSGDAGNPAFMSIVYNMLAKIDQNVIQAAGQRTYEYELRINKALSEAMRTGDYSKWDETVTAPLALSMDKDIKNIIARTPVSEIQAVRQTATHAWLRNQSHSRSLYRWARNIKDEGTRSTVLGLIDRITEQHAFTVGESLSDSSITSATKRLQSVLKDGKGWYSFIPFSADKFAKNGMAPIVTAVHEQLFTSYDDLIRFYNEVKESRAELFASRDQTSLVPYLAQPTALTVAGETASTAGRSFAVEVDGVKVDSSSLIEQMFGLHVDNLDAAFQQFQMQWLGTQLTKWITENQSVVSGTNRSFSQRLAELYQGLMTGDPDAYTKSGLSKDFVIGGKQIDLDSALRLVAQAAGTPENFENGLRYYAGQSDIAIQFSAETGLKVVPHAVLDHIANKIFTNQDDMIRFMTAVAGDTSDTVSQSDVIRARNLFNTVEHIVRTDAKIRSSALRNWKSYELVKSDPNSYEVIIRSPDRDIAADEVGASKSGALYRVNMQTGKTHLVAESRRYDAQTNKWVETYENIQDIDDYLRYNWVRKPNETARRDPFAFDAKPRAIKLDAKQLFGFDDFLKVNDTLMALAGEYGVSHGVVNDEPVYFMLPISIAELAASEINIFDPDVPIRNAGMNIIKGTYDKKEKQWSFVDTSNNWQDANNYRSQMPMGLLEMVISPFDKSSAMTLTYDRQQEIAKHKMLQEEYHIAKLLLAKDRNVDNPQHSEFTKVGKQALFNSESDLMQDASTGTWFSSSPKFMDETPDNIPELRKPSALHVNDTEDPIIQSSMGVLDDLAADAKEKAFQVPQEVTFYRDPKTKGGMLQSGTKDKLVLQVSSDIYDKLVTDPLKGSQWETTVKDGQAITLDGADADVYFASTPKFVDTAYNVYAYGLKPLQDFFRGVLGLDLSAFAIQLGSMMVRAPYQTFKALVLSVPELFAGSSADIGLVLGSLWHGARQQRRLKGEGQWFNQSLNLDARYYDFIMNSVVDRFNQTNIGTTVSMSELIDDYYMQSSYSDWYKRSKANMIADPTKYKSIIDTPWESQRENVFSGGIMGTVVPGWRRAEMTRQLILDLAMLQQSLSAVKDARANQAKNKDRDISDSEVDKDIKAALTNLGKEIGIGSHARSKTQAPIWRALSNVVQYFMTAPSYTRNFNQFVGFTPFVGAKQKINEWSKVATQNGPAWLQGEVFDIESDLRHQNFETAWAKSRRQSYVKQAAFSWMAIAALNAWVNFQQHQKNRPYEEEDKTSWMDIMSKRFGYVEVNDNWAVQVPVLGRIAGLVKPLAEAASVENYGPLEKIEAGFNGLAKQLIKNKIHNGGQFIMSAFSGKTFKGLPAGEQDAGLKVAVENDVRAPFYFHPTGYLFPQQSKLAMDTMTLAHQRAYYDDLLKLAIYSEMAKKGLNEQQIMREGGVLPSVRVSRQAANELWWKGTVPRLLGFNVMYEPYGYKYINKFPTQFGQSSTTLGRIAYMSKDWYNYPNLFETMRDHPRQLISGWPIQDVSGPSLGFPSSESQARSTPRERIRLPLNNVTRALIQYNSDNRGK